MSQCDCERCKPPIEPCNCPQSLALLDAIDRISALSAPGRADHNGTDMRAIHRISTAHKGPHQTETVVMSVNELIETAERGGKLIDALRRIVAAVDDCNVNAAGTRDAVDVLTEINAIAREVLR